MRKLVKKLALVLVIIMAVSCIAPASAQAAEKAGRWTWNFDTEGIKKPTKNMYVGETFKFQLLDKGVAVDTAIYTVSYYSRNEKGKDHSALLVGKDSGIAYAFSKAEDVKLAAVVRNKTTKDIVKVWAFVDIHEKENLEFKAVPSISFDEALAVGTTFKVDAYVCKADGSRVDKNVNFAISDDKVITSEDGVNFKAVGNGEAKIVFAADGFSNIVYTVTVSSGTPTAAPTAKPTANPSTLSVVSVKQPTSTSFEVTFNKEIGTSDNVKSLTSVKLAQKNSTLKYSTPVKSATTKGNVLTVTLYNKPSNEQSIYIIYNGVEAPGYKINIGSVAEIIINTALVEYQTFADINVTAKDANGTLLYNGKLSANTLGLTATTVGSNAYDAFISDTKQIYFMEQGKSVDVIVSSADGKVSAGATISSVESVMTEGAYDSFAIDTPGKTTTDALKKLTYKATGTIAVGESKQLYAKRTNVTIGLETETTTEYTPGKGYTYTSTDSTVLLVNSGSGLLIPIAEGTAEVLIWDRDTVIAVCPITVTATKKATAAAWQLSKNHGSNSVSANDKIVATITVMDQYGEEVPAENAIITFKRSGVDANEFTVTPVNDKNEMTISLAGIKAGTYTATLETNGIKVQNTLTFVVNTPDLTSSRSYKLQTDNNVTLWEADPAQPEALSITLYEYDTNGVAIGVGTINGSVNDAGLVANNIYYEVAEISGSNLSSSVYIDNGKLAVYPYRNGETVEGACRITVYRYETYAGEAVTRLVPIATTNLVIKSAKNELTVNVESTTSDTSYSSAIAGVTVSNGTFSVKSNSIGGSLDNLLAQSVFDAFRMYIGDAKDANLVTIGTIESVTINGYTDSTATVVVSDISVTKGGIVYSHTFTADTRAVITFK